MADEASDGVPVHEEEVLLPRGASWDDPAHDDVLLQDTPVHGEVPSSSRAISRDADDLVLLLARTLR